jgi:hypothetical protein
MSGLLFTVLVNNDAYVFTFNKGISSFSFYYYYYYYLSLSYTHIYTYHDLQGFIEQATLAGPAKISESVEFVVESEPHQQRLTINTSKGAGGSDRTYDLYCYYCYYYYYYACVKNR